VNTRVLQCVWTLYLNSITHAAAPGILTGLQAFAPPASAVYREILRQAQFAGFTTAVLITLVFVVLVYVVFHSCFLITVDVIQDMFRNIRDGRYTEEEFTAVAGPWPFERHRHRRREGRSHRRMRPLTNAEFDCIISGEAAAHRQRSVPCPVLLPPPPAPHRLLRGALRFIPPLPFAAWSWPELPGIGLSMSPTGDLLSPWKYLDVGLLVSLPNNSYNESHMIGLTHTATSHTATAVRCMVVAGATNTFGAIGRDIHVQFSGCRHVAHSMAATWYRRGIVHHPGRDDGNHYFTHAVDARQRRSIIVAIFAPVGHRN